MSRKRLTHTHLPPYVEVHHGSYRYGPPGVPKRTICKLGEEHLLYKFMAAQFAPTEGESVPEGQPMRVYFNKYRTEILPRLAARTQKDYRRHLNTLEPVFGSARPEEITSKAVARYLHAKPMGQGLVQHKQQIAVLSAVFTEMVNTWYVAETNPCTGVRRPKIPPRRRNVRDAEYKAVYMLASPRMKIAMDLALLTGQRRGDLLQLRWRDIGTKTDGIYFRQGKTGIELDVALSEALQEVLARARALTPVPCSEADHVLRNEEGQGYTGDGFSSNWTRLMDRALALKVIDQSFHFHDIRALNAARSKSVQEAYERLGHVSIATTRRIYDGAIRKVTPLR